MRSFFFNLMICLLITNVARAQSDKLVDPESMAVNQRLNEPRGLKLDQQDNVFFADTKNNRICKIDKATKVLSTIAGTGAQGFSGDGGPATQATLYWPYDIALSSTGDIYVADTYNGRIRIIDAKSGIINSLNYYNPKGNLVAYEGTSLQITIGNNDDLYIISFGKFLQRLNLKTLELTNFTNILSPDCLTLDTIRKRLFVSTLNVIQEINLSEVREANNGKNDNKMVQVNAKVIFDGNTNVSNSNEKNGSRPEFENYNVWQMIWMETYISQQATLSPP